MLLGIRRGIDLHVAGKGLSSRVSRLGVNLASSGEEDNDTAPLYTTPSMVVVVV